MDDHGQSLTLGQGLGQRGRLLEAETRNWKAIHSLTVPVPPAPPDVSFTIPKLRHDIEQIRYLQRRGLLGDEFTPIIKDYQNVVDRLTPLGIHARVPLDAETREKIGHVYNRIVHVRDTPRVQQALSGKWDAATVETDYLDSSAGIVIVDDFLSKEALECLRLFCLESTIWSSNHHPHGGLCALFRDGFCCPLLFQLAEELRDALPRVLGSRHPLRDMWGYKTLQNLAPDSTTHADFAAVNVNLWITPEDANLDRSSGGLLVYGVDAPLHWNFPMYNARSEDVINPYLQRQQPRAVVIPYQQNRAVIFESDLFHKTAEVRFRSGYENHHLNITMLYGHRGNDVHHRGLARPIPLGAPAAQISAWRSAAFSRARRRCRV